MRRTIFGQREDTPGREVNQHVASFSVLLQVSLLWKEVSCDFSSGCLPSLVSQSLPLWLFVGFMEIRFFISLQLHTYFIVLAYGSRHVWFSLVLGSLDIIGDCGDDEHGFGIRMAMLGSVHVVIAL